MIFALADRRRPCGTVAAGDHLGRRSDMGDPLASVDLSIGDEQRGPIRLALLGKPGSGKGTQGAALAQHFGVPLISMETCCAAARPAPPRRRVTFRGCSTGASSCRTNSSCPSCRDAVNATPGGGYILDGFPRTVAQARADVAPVDAVVDLALSDDVAASVWRGARQRSDRRRRSRRDRTPAPPVPLRCGTDHRPLPRPRDPRDGRRRRVARRGDRCDPRGAPCVAIGNTQRSTSPPFADLDRCRP